jgi:betaine lipid synthase
VKLSRPNAFDGLRIHTDEFKEVLARITPSTLTIAIVMDSMDWFEPKDSAADDQIVALNHALKIGGRVMLRSASLNPWYIDVFEAEGFSVRRVGERKPGSCIDRFVFHR